MSSIHPRRMARSIARAQLDKAGATGYNKQRGVDMYGRRIPSAFSGSWQSIARKALQPRKENRA